MVSPLNCILCFLASAQYCEQPMPFISSQLTAHSTRILAAYRKNCAASMSSGQLVLPDALKLLPLYTSSLLKLPGFLQGTLPKEPLAICNIYGLRWPYRLESRVDE